MQVLVLVKATEDSEKGFEPTPWSKEMLEAMGRFNDELRVAGVLPAAGGLTPSSRGRRIHIDGNARTVSHDPFPEPRHLMAGYWWWEVKDMDEAMAWPCAARIPCPARATSNSDRSTARRT